MKRIPGQITGMDMRFALILACCGFLVSAAHCTGRRVIAFNDVKRKFEHTATRIKNDAGLRENAGSIRVGNSGYFYIIDSNGRIAAHPQKALVGFMFEDNPLVKKMRSGKRGCVLQRFDGASRMVLFATLDSGDIVCLSISPDEIDGGMFQCPDAGGMP